MRNNVSKIIPGALKPSIALKHPPNSTKIWIDSEKCHRHPIWFNFIHLHPKFTLFFVRKSSTARIPYRLPMGGNFSPAAPACPDSALPKVDWSRWPDAPGDTRKGWDDDLGEKCPSFLGISIKKSMICDMWYVICDIMWCVMCDVWCVCVMCDVWCVI